MNMNKTETETCSICCEDLDHNFTKTKCGHRFHFECILKWTDKNLSCPMCRAEISDEWHCKKKLKWTKYLKKQNKNKILSDEDQEIQRQNDAMRDEIPNIIEDQAPYYKAYVVYKYLLGLHADDYYLVPIDEYKKYITEQLDAVNN